MSLWQKILSVFAPPETRTPEPDDEVLDPFNPFPEPIETPLTDILDLHTVQPREVKKVTEGYLADAYDAGFSTVRLIHGKGIGVQREIVRKVLERTEFVDTFTDAPPEAGGWGATIVRFKQRLTLT